MNLESRRQKVTPFHYFLFRPGRYGLFALGLIVFSVLLGSIGYHSESASSPSTISFYVIRRKSIMKKVRILFHKLNLVLILFMCILISSCSGHDGSSKASKTQTETQDSILQPKQSNEQISQVVRVMFQDSKGNYWFGAEEGAYWLSNDSLIYIDSIKSELGKRVTIKDITEGKDGTIWFGHTDGISSIIGETIVNYYESDGLLSNDVWCIEAGPDGKIWVGTIEGVCQFDGQKFTNFEMPEGKIDTSLGISSTKMVHNISKDSRGTLWLCTNAGLFSYTENNLNHISKKVDIPANFVNAVFEDRSGEIWVSTKQGLYKLTGNKAINITEGKIETGKGIGSIAEDKNGTIWFVSNQHSLFTYEESKLSEFQKSEENKGPVVFQIYKDQEGRLWFVGFGGAFRLENGKFLHIKKDGPW